jgi:type IV pilus assembly protein PilB
VARKFGEIAIEEGFITQEQLGEALQRQREDKRLIGQILVELGFLTTAQLDEIIQIQIAEMAR